MDFIVKILYLWLTLFLQCGAPMQHRLSKRLVDSDEVPSVNEFPYIVPIQNLEGPISVPYWNDKRKDATKGIFPQMCAGIIISEYWMLTAANCVKKNSGEMATFKVGGLGQDSYYPVDKIIIHPNFKPIRTEHPANDIAALHVNESFFGHNPNVSSIALGRIPDKSGIRVQTTSWNYTRSSWYVHVYYLRRLRKLSLQTVDSGNCRKIHNKVGNVVDNEICVSGASGKALCNVNAGNPLITLDKKRLVGIFSVYETCKEDSSGVFTRLSVYIDWLRKVTGLKLPLD